jgi:hypothetical protein
VESKDAAGLVVKTSARDWLTALAHAYQAQASVTLIDDANLGVDPISQTLLEMGRKANLEKREWYGVFTALGISGAGLFLLCMAVVDPEPFSKISFALGTGAALIMGGGVFAIRILTGHRPPNVKVSATGGFEISWV